MPSPKPCTPIFGEISLKFLYKPTRVPRCTKKIKIKTKKIKIKTTSCNPTVPGSVAVCLQEFLGRTPPQQQIIDCIETAAPHLLPANAPAGGFFFFLQRFDSEVWPDSQLSNSFNKSSPHHAQKQKANLCLPGTC